VCPGVRRAGHGPCARAPAPGGGGYRREPPSPRLRSRSDPEEDLEEPRDEAFDFDRVRDGVDRVRVRDDEERVRGADRVPDDRARCGALRYRSVARGRSIDDRVRSVRGDRVRRSDSERSRISCR
jgi:hypothetical protein